MSDLIDFQYEIGAWHRRRFPDATVTDCVLKLVSEVGELADAILGDQLGGKGDMADELGDCLIVLTSIADRLEVSLHRAGWDKFRQVQGYGQ